MLATVSESRTAGGPLGRQVCRSPLRGEGDVTAIGPLGPVSSRGTTEDALTDGGLVTVRATVTGPLAFRARAGRGAPRSAIFSRPELLRPAGPSGTPSGAIGTELPSTMETRLFRLARPVKLRRGRRSAFVRHGTAALSRSSLSLTIATGVLAESPPQSRAPDTLLAGKAEVSVVKRGRVIGKKKSSRRLLQRGVAKKWPRWGGAWLCVSDASDSRAVGRG